MYERTFLFGKLPGNARLAF